VSASYSDLAIKNGNRHWLTVKRTIDPNATYVSIELGRVNSALGKVSTVGDVVYCTKPVLMMGGKLRPQTHIPQKRLLKYTPVSGNTGKLGDECIDDNYYYVWTADNTVKRVALTSF
jgi:hypothetical protein